MIVNSRNIEFGYELISVLPYAYSLYTQGKLKGTVSGNDTDCLYYFSPAHKVNKEPRSWYNTPQAFAPNINIHRHTLDKKNWLPPPLKKQYQNKAIKFKKETIIICNRHNIEWSDRPINYFDVDTLRKLFELFQDEYQIVYINIEGRPELYDNAPPITLGDYKLLKEYPKVINIHDLHKEYFCSFNELQLRLFAGCEKYITMNGGHSILASYFGGENIIMSKYGKPQTQEINQNVNSFYRWYHEFGNQRIIHVSDEKELLRKATSIYKKKQPLINLLVRTSGRQRYFENCIQSIKKQDYNNYRIFVSTDNNDEYIIKEPVYPVYIDNVTIENVKKENKDGIVFVYNHYINVMQEKINSGYIMYLDDDDKLTNNTALTKIANELNKNDLVFWKAEVGKKVLPPAQYWGGEPQLFNVSGISYCFNSKYKGFAKWRPYKRADYYCAKSLYDNIKNIGWINEVLAATQNGSHSGMRVDKPKIKNKIPMKQKVKLVWIKNSHGRVLGQIEEMTSAKAAQFIKAKLVKEQRPDIEVKISEQIEKVEEAPRYKKVKKTKRIKK